MKKTNILLLIIVLTGSWLTAQVKIGENPQNIDPASVLELESTDKVLVITRVTTAQMNAIVPSQGALCYNTDVQAVHYFDGTQWVNIGSGGTGGNVNITADPIVNPQSTIVITTTANGDNLEVAPNSIRSEQIVDGGVNGVDIQDGSIGPGKLQDNSVTEEKLSENSVGTFALDNANIGLSAFTNDEGYITAANVVSTDANNALQIGTDNGAFYDELPLINAIQNNTDAINADGDTNATNEIQSLAISGNDITISGSNTITLPTGAVADGSETIVTAGTNVTVTGDGTAATPYIIAAAGGAAGTTEEADQITITGIGTNADPFKIEPGTAGQILTTDATGVVWANAAPGGGSTEEADQTTITGVGTNADPFKIEPSATDGQVLTTTGGVPVWADLPPSGGSALFDINTISGTGVAGDEYTVADDGISTVKILDANVTPEKVAPSATDGQVLTTTGGATVWADLPPSGGAALFDATTISGTGVAGDEYTVADDAITTVKILDANVTPEKIAPAAALTPAADQMLITTDAGVVEWAPLASHLGTPNSVFIADETTGEPVNAINPVNDPSFEWIQSARLGYGQLQIGLDGFPASDDVSKVIIAESTSLGSDVSYPLLIHTPSPGAANASTGILFSPETESGSFGAISKGALIYQRTGGFATGDFHFLQTNIQDFATRPLTTDKAFTVRNNKDIVIYGGVEVNGDGLGAPGEVLTSNGTTVEWAAAGGGGADDQDATEVNLATAIDIDGDSTNELTVEDAIIALNATNSDDQNAAEVDLVTAVDIDGDLIPETTVEEAISKLAAATGGENLSNTNLTQTTGENRTYDLNGQDLIFNGTGGQIGIGNFGTNPAPASIRSKLDVDGQITASNGFASSAGSALTPGFGFFTNGDTDTGMFRAFEDQLGFSTGGIETIRINAAQNVGIGEINPTEKLHINGNLRIDNGNIIARNGPATAIGQVLTNTINGTEWAAAGGLPTGGTNGQVLSTDGSGTYSWVNNDDQDASEVVLNPTIDVDGDGTNEATVQQAIADLSANIIIAKGRVTTPGTTGAYTENVAGGLPAGAIINLSVEQSNTAPFMIQITGRTATGFSVQIYQWDVGSGDFIGVDAIWNYTIINP